MEGVAPAFSEMKALGEHVSDSLGRVFYAYRITDKRNRAHNIRLDDGSSVQLGTRPSQWLLGYASPVRRGICVKDHNRLVDIASTFFEAQPKGPGVLEAPEPSLFEY